MKLTCSRCGVTINSGSLCDGCIEIAANEAIGKRKVLESIYHECNCGRKFRIFTCKGKNTYWCSSCGRDWKARYDLEVCGIIVEEIIKRRKTRYEVMNGN